MISEEGQEYDLTIPGGFGASFRPSLRPLRSDLDPTPVGQFSQHYDYERKIDLAKLLLRLEPRVAPSTITEEGPRWICAEAGLGPALIHYFVRSLVDAEVGVAEWPPASEFDDGPIRRYLFLFQHVMTTVTDRIDALVDPAQRFQHVSQAQPGRSVARREFQTALVGLGRLLCQGRRGQDAGQAVVGLGILWLQVEDIAVDVDGLLVSIHFPEHATQFEHGRNVVRRAGQ